MPGSVESSDFRLEKVSLRFFRNLGAGQFFDGYQTTSAAVAGAIEVVPAGRADNSSHAVNAVERGADWICAG